MRGNLAPLTDQQSNTACVRSQLATTMLIHNTINVYSEETLQQIAREQFHEDEEEMEEAVRGLQEWIVSCPHLQHGRRDKGFLR